VTMPGNIAGDTTAGAAVAATVGVHLSPHLPPSPPAGADAKSIAIEAAINSFLVSARAELRSYNSSVDALNRGLAYAPTTVDSTDQAGADGVASSGRMTI
jgi:hypothetical protein